MNKETKKFLKARARAEIMGLTFHDFRGTAITNAYREQPEKDLAALATRFGLSLQSINDLLDRHYLAPNQGAADDIVRRIESKKRPIHRVRSHMRP